MAVEREERLGIPVERRRTRRGRLATDECLDGLHHALHPAIAGSVLSPLEERADDRKSPEIWDLHFLEIPVGFVGLSRANRALSMRRSVTVAANGSEQAVLPSDDVRQHMRQPLVKQHSHPHFNSAMSVLSPRTTIAAWRPT